MDEKVWLSAKREARRKRYLKILASSYFTDLKVTLKTADAILIAKYGFEELGRD